LVQLLAGGWVPEKNRVIADSRSQGLAVGRDRDRVNHARRRLSTGPGRVMAELAQLPFRGQVPEADRVVVAARSQDLAVRGEGKKWRSVVTPPRNRDRFPPISQKTFEIAKMGTGFAPQ